MQQTTIVYHFLQYLCPFVEYCMCIAQKKTLFLWSSGAKWEHNEFRTMDVGKGFSLLVLFFRTKKKFLKNPVFFWIYPTRNNKHGKQGILNLSKINSCFCIKCIFHETIFSQIDAPIFHGMVSNDRKELCKICCSVIEAS